MPRVAALFVRSDSCYFGLGVDCWDAARDARGYGGPGPVVWHPPCRGWGRLRNFAKPRADEKALALFAVDCVRRYGGVLEHPHGSSLWPAGGLPRPGVVDAWGGWTLVVDQGWWGHPAPKPTYLYIVGCSRADVPVLPVKAARAGGRTLELRPADRERTPVAFAAWLVGLAASCAVAPSQALVTPAGNAVTSTWRTGSYAEPACQLHALGAYSAEGKAARKRAAFRDWARGGV